MSEPKRFNQTAAFVASIAAITAVLITGIVVIGTRSTSSAPPITTSSTSTTVPVTTTVTAPATTTTRPPATTTTLTPDRITVGLNGEVVWETGWSIESQAYQCCFPTAASNLTYSAGCQGGAASVSNPDPAQRAYYLDGREC